MFAWVLLDELCGAAAKALANCEMRELVFPADSNSEQVGARESKLSRLL